jgi:hypothetical protein
MSNKTMRSSMAFVSGGALIAGAIVTAIPSWAATVPANTAVLRTPASNQVTDVHYYRRGYYRHRYYGRGYYPGRYGYPWWGDPYAYACPYSYPYAYSYLYPYYYSYPFSVGFGWGWGGW